MKTRVFFLFALIFCACDPATGEAEEVKGEVKEQSSGEIMDVVEYHPNGALKMRGKSQGGKRIGKWESYYPTGYLWSEATYRKGHREGEAVTYYPNGMMRYQGRYYNDEQTGIWMFYNEKGTLIDKIDMDDPNGGETLRTDSTGLH